MYRNAGVRAGSSIAFSVSIGLNRPGHVTNVGTITVPAAAHWRKTVSRLASNVGVGGKMLCSMLDALAPAEAGPMSPRKWIPAAAGMTAVWTLSGVT